MLRRAVKRQRKDCEGQEGNVLTVRIKKKNNASSQALGESPVKDEEERFLEKLVLGDEQGLQESLERKVKKVSVKNHVLLRPICYVPAGSKAWH